MSNIKNKQTVYLVCRYDDVCCAVCRTEDRAFELAGEYSQQYRDLGATGMFYVMGQTFYDE